MKINVKKVDEFHVMGFAESDSPDARSENFRRDEQTKRTGPAADFWQKHFTLDERCGSSIAEELT